MVLHTAPTVPLYKYLLRNLSQRWKLINYQAAVLILTFMAYTSYHLAKRSFSIVKSELGCNKTMNNSCEPWPPFDDQKKNKDLFGLLDCAFLMSYALAMFVSGYIAEHTNLRIYLSVGMVLTGVFTGLSGLAYYLNIHSLSFFVLLQIITGITQSTGWPCVVEAVGVWFPEGRRGFVMGVWNTHVSIGNILGSLVAGAFVDTNWGLSFVIPGIIIASVGVIIFIFLIPHPSHVGLHEHKKQPAFTSSRTDILPSPDPLRKPNKEEVEEEEVEPEAIGIWGAFKIPGVVEYSLCLFFAKLVSYTFLFWLPYYIQQTPIDGKKYDSGKAADWATLFDVGGAAGGIVAGLLTDYTHHPGLVNVIMLLCAGPSLFLFYFHGTANVTLFVTYMITSGFFVNGPYALITTAVSASLGTHECLRGNTKAMAVVTSIIDGTGSLGAAIGPLLAGVISESTGSWTDVFYMLIIADIIAAILLSRQFAHEMKEVYVKLRYRLGRSNSDSVNTFDENEPLLTTA